MKTQTEARVCFQFQRLLVLLWLLMAAPSLLAQATITSIPGLGGAYYELRALNRTGMVAGYSYTADNSDQHAILFRNGALYDLGGFLSHLFRGGILVQLAVVSCRRSALALAPAAFFACACGASCSRRSSWPCTGNASGRWKHGRS